MTAGLLLAAGAGRRMGTPKALVVGEDGEPWLHRGIRVLAEGGCSPVVVVVGAEAAAARAVADAAPAPALVVEAAEWDAGLSASLRAGLDALALTSAQDAIVLLVDLPDVGAEVVARVRASARGSAGGSATLARAAYDSVPGHPVLLGRDHWAGVAEAAVGDDGAKPYLRDHPPLLVECGDLAGGRDVDERPVV